MDEQNRNASFSRALVLIRNLIPRKARLELFSYQASTAFKKYLPQVLSLFDSAQKPEPPLGETIEFVTLLSEAGTYMWENGYLKDCRRVMERAEQILHQIDSSSLDWECADINSTLGILCTSIGVSRRAEGLQRCREASEVRKRIENSYAEVPLAVEVETVCAWADLARAYLEDEQFDGAEELMEKCKSYYQKWGTEEQEPWHWSRWYQHMAYVKTYRGEHVEAVTWAHRATELQEKATGNSSSLTQIYRFALAHFVYHAGDYPQALTHFKTVYNSCVQLLGDYNHLTQTSHFAYGMLQWINGNPDEAEYALLSLLIYIVLIKVTSRHNIKACLQEDKKSLWSEEQEARAQYYLAKLLRSRGDLVEANRMERIAEETRGRLIVEYPDFLGANKGSNSDIIYDLMVPIGRLRFSGKLHGGRPLDWYKV